MAASIAGIEQRPFLFQNWARSSQCRTRSLFCPTSIEQIQRIVRFAKATSCQVRAIGAGHSPGDICATDGYMISLAAMNRAISIDTAKQTATFQAGIFLYECIAHLREHQLALPVLGSISQQTLAGTISTASHGHGYHSRTLSAYVESLVLVDGDGAVRTCSREQDADLFLATLCGLGATGILVEVTLRCTTDYCLEEETFGMEFDEYVKAINGPTGSSETGLFNSAAHVRAYWYPQISKVRVQRASISKKPITGVSWIRWFIFERLLGRYFHIAGLFFARYFPSYLQWHARIMWRLTESPRRLPRGQTSMAISEKAPWRRMTSVDTTVDRYERIFNYDCGPRQYTFECAVPIDRAVAALYALRAWLEGEYANPSGLRHHFPLEMRIVDGDDIWLSPAYGGRVLWIGIMQYKPYGFPVPHRRLFREFERIALSHGGRPHWAKAHSATTENLERMYTALPRWRHVRDQVDPQGIFQSPYVQRHLYGHVKE